MPDRGLLAPLSPNEEVTRRRVAIGIATPARLSERDLKALSLIEEHGGGLRLTPRERYLALPKSAAASIIPKQHRMTSFPGWPTS